jgi:hypothetical protein
MADADGKDEHHEKDEAIALAAEGEEDALLGLAAAEADDDKPAPETGLHALGQLGTAVVVVGALVVIFLAVALAAGWIFR